MILASRPVILIVAISVFAGCASLGTSVKVFDPAQASRLRTLAIWPVAVIPLVEKSPEVTPELLEVLLADADFRMRAENYSRLAERHLAHELDSCGLFELIGVDSVVSTVANNGTVLDRFVNDWREHRRAIDTDGLLVSEISFGRESGGINSYATLSVYDRRHADPVVVAKFNTKWGKSYLLVQSADVTLPDAIHGAVRGLSKKLREYRQGLSSARVD